MSEIINPFHDNYLSRKRDSRVPDLVYRCPRNRVDICWIVAVFFMVNFPSTNETKSMKVAVVQISDADLRHHNIEDINCIKPIRNSGLFDKVVLAAPDMQSSRKLLEDFARVNETEIHFGSTDNVALRLAELSDKFGAEVIFRCLAHYLHIDFEYVQRKMFALQVRRLDYLADHQEMNIVFGGDVTSGGFFRKILCSKKFRHATTCEKFNPWGLVESWHPNGDNEITMDWTKLDELPVWDWFKYKACQLEFDYLRRGIRARSHAHSPMASYRRAAETLIGRTDCRIADVASGTGDGSRLLAEKGASVLGVEPDRLCYEHASNLCAGYNVELIQSQYGLLDNVEYRDTFDGVVSIHTMEHVVDDHDFLKVMSSALRPGGRIFLEVPRLSRYPFRDIPIPWIIEHYREYDLQDLEEKVSRHFVVDECFGVSRGFFAHPSRARSALGVVASKRL